MKKQLFSLSLIILLGGGVLAQKNEGKKEITIEKKQNNGKTEKTIIIIDGDKVTVNGEEVKDLNGKLDMLGNGNFNYQDFGKAFGDSRFNFKSLSDSFGQHGKMFREFKNAGSSNKAMLGVNVEKDEKGAKITEVTAESGAANAGLLKDDIITAINGDKIANGDELVKAVGKYKPEDVVDVTVLRNGTEKKFKATLGKNSSSFSNSYSWNMNEDALRPSVPPVPRGDFFKLDENGVRGFALANDRPKFGFGIKDNENGDGAVVTTIKEESAAAKAGLKENDIVTEVGGTAVKTTDDLKRLLADNRSKTEITVKVLRNGSPQTLTLKVPKKIKTAEL
jgi:serine protease Do